MTDTHTPRLYFALLLLFLSFERGRSTATWNVKCLVINLEYVECKWHPMTTKMNYTFSSAFKDEALDAECPKYILEDSSTIGCRIPLKQQDNIFDKFYTKISTGNHSVSKAFESLSGHVHLNPPFNLSAVWFEQNSTLVLHWMNSTNFKKKCSFYMVHQRTNTDQYFNVTETSYSIPLVSRNKQYAFRVRSIHSCSSSNHWSSWSASLNWGKEATSSWWQWLSGIVSLILLVLLLCYCERRKIIILPIVPDPSKNLQDLFHKHDGNVESWVHISKELKEAFEPDYTEPACNVCEVTPPCDVSAIAETTPTSKAETCDKTNSEEEPEKQLSL